MLKYIFIFLIFPLASLASEFDTALGKVTIEPIVTGLNEPWSLGFAPDGFFITERGGSLTYYSNKIAIQVAGVPKTQQGGQAGLFDVLIPADFATSQTLFLSYAHPDGLGTAVARARYLDGALTDLKEIFVMNSPSRSNIHFGGRLVEANDTEIYLTIGERGDASLAQDMSVDNGSVVRIKKDGSGYQRISKGHRNPQGAAKDNAGSLFVNEHGAQGGDELNVIIEGTNYGWPVISYGVNYDGSKIGEGTAKEGLAQPLFYWDPSIAPSGLAIHSGKGWASAKDVAFIGSLKFDQIALVRQGKTYQQIGTIESEETARIRDVREAPDGSIWFLSVNNGALYRVAPAN